MRLLHTSDWHLGKRLFDKERYDVFENFLTWLLSTIRKERVDTLIVAGEIGRASCRERVENGVA